MGERRGGGLAEGRESSGLKWSEVSPKPQLQCRSPRRVGTFSVLSSPCVGVPHSARIKTRGLWDHCVSPQTPSVLLKATAAHGASASVCVFRLRITVCTADGWGAGHGEAAMHAPFEGAVQALPEPRSGTTHHPGMAMSLKTRHRWPPLTLRKARGGGAGAHGGILRGTRGEEVHLGTVAQ